MNSRYDVDGNLETAERLLREAAAGGAQLAALPELFSYLGPREGIAGAAERLGSGPATRMLSRVASERGMWVLGGSIPESADGRVFNTATLFDRSGELVARYRKIHLFDVELAGQPAFR